MVPGFLVFHTDRSSAAHADARIALASPWDFDDGSGSRTKICGPPYTNTKCVPPVLYCHDCRQCHWGDSFGLFEDCAFWYPCGVCSEW